ncbi:filamentous hemagglutinin N-terminal domain-containing protein [Alkalimarinus alittae]|uniref:Filamentous hemagglutinin N-terminal domain-containing protein n=1 Tax=Alkalimarinus alittae TaxID=2961619 RepID=A0ABY6N3F3_9ALTE|nr:filamentous hemagglutinin N-terminal domain-containing protein [Alkalimarinus alittae]UZE96641.1 filamentous hemagglutinin N-terminal domain-containing protein [Alkalimarinus alittae]
MQHAYRNSRTRQTVSLLLIFQLVFSPLYSSLALAGGLTVDANASSAHQPTIDAAGNGVPIVQITAPSASGVSLNKYNQFNINNNGLILNNSQQIIKTQLSGYIEGNSNLATSNGARIIVNQINGGLPSALNGYAEVAGQQADVIIANPGGITCNGCGFINTNRGVLTTGTVELDSAGAVNNIRINQGVLQVNGRGLNASNINQLDLLARAIEVNADIHGQQINAITGTNRVDYSDLSTTTIEGVGDTPSLSLDVSALGGMYANRIFMVGTEKGVGVNSEGVIGAAKGGLILTAEGDIKLKNTHSESASLLTSTSGSIELVGDHFSEQKISLAAGNDIKIDGAVGAQDTVTVSSNRLIIENSGSLSAGYDDAGLQRGEGKLDIKTSAMLNNGSVVAQDISVIAQQLENEGSVAQVGNGDVSIIADSLVRNSGTLSATKQLSINTADYDNSDGTVVSRGDLQVDAVDITNQNGRLISESIVKLNGDQLDNTQGTLLGEKGISIDVATIVNDAGKIHSLKNLSVDANTLNNTSGEIVGVGAVDISALDTTNLDGTIQSNELLSVTGNLIDNRRGSMRSAKGVFLNADSISNESGKIQSEAILGVVSNHLKNSDGELLVLAGEDLRLNLKTLDNRGGLIETNASNLTLNVERIDNSEGGKISHYGDQTLQFLGDTLNNQLGDIQSNGQIDINERHLIDNSKGDISAIKSIALSVASGDVNNSDGKVEAELSLNVIAQNVINQYGEMTSNQSISLSSDHLMNDNGLLVGQKALTLKTATLTNDAGELQAGTVLSYIGNVLDNSQGVLVGGNGVNLVANTIINAFGQLQTGSTLQLTADKLENQNGSVLVLSDADQEVTLTTLDNRNGEFETNAKHLTLDVSYLDNSAGGKITHFGDQSTVIRGSELNNQNGIISSNGLLDITEDRRVNNNDGQITAVKNLQLLVTTGDVQNNSGLFESGGLLDITASIINNNRGKISSQQAQRLSAAGIQNQLGKIESATTLDVNATSLDNRKGSLLSLSSSDQKLDINQIDNREGSLASNANNWVIESTQLNNTVGGSISHHGIGMASINAGTNNNSGAIKSNGMLTLNQKGVLDNRSGLVSSVSDLTINASEINNQKGEVAAGGSISLIFSLGNRLLDNTLSGMVQAVSSLSISNLATLKNQNGQILANNQLSILADHFNYQGQIDAGYIDVSSHNEINIAAGQLWNTAGQLTLRAAGHLVLNGEINTGRNYELIARDMTVGNSGILAGASQGNIAISNNFSNYNRVSSNQALPVVANKFDNYGDFGGLTTELNVGSLYNTGLLFGQSSLNIYSNSLYNDRGDIFTFGDMTLAKDSALNKSHEITNNHGLIQSEGNLRFNTKSFLMWVVTRRVLQISSLRRQFTHMGRMRSM